MPPKTIKTVEQFWEIETPITMLTEKELMQLVEFATKPEFEICKKYMKQYIYTQSYPLIGAKDIVRNIDVEGIRKGFTEFIMLPTRARKEFQRREELKKSASAGPKKGKSPTITPLTVRP